MERWREQLYLEHSAKGTTWGRHKYVAIKNGRYIYPEDLKKKVKNGLTDAGVKLNRKLRGMTPDQISYNGGKFTFDRLDDGKNRSTTRPVGTSVLRTKYNGNKDVSLRDYGNNGYSKKSQYKNGRLRNGYPDDAVYKNYEYHKGSDSYKYVDHKTDEQVKEIAKKQQATATMARTKKGTEAGRKRVEAEKRKKQAEATEKRIQKGLAAARERTLKRAEAEKRKETKSKLNKAINKQVSSAVSAQEKGKQAISKMRTSKGDGTVMRSIDTPTGRGAQIEDKAKTRVKKNVQAGRTYSYTKGLIDFAGGGYTGLSRLGPNGKRSGIDRHSASSGSDYVKPADRKRINDKLNANGGYINSLSDEEKKMFFKMIKKGKK